MNEESAARMRGNAHARLGDETMDSKLFLACSRQEKSRWVHESSKRRMKLAAWVRETLNAAVDNLEK